MFGHLSIIMLSQPTFTREFAVALIGSALTLYMMAILVRWLGPWLEMDLRRGVLRFVPRVADPLIAFIRRFLPNMGPMDWSPIAALMLVWIVRIILVGG